jgi:hypothetical protein
MKKLVVVVAAMVALAFTGTASAGSSCWYSARGCVSVSGYYRSNGHYVRPYYRNYPYYRSYSYSYPSYRSYSYSYPSYRSYSYSYSYRW